METIAQDPTNRFDWWIMKTFNVLPTSQEFKDLTAMQKDLLWYNYLEDNPKVKQKIKNTVHDEDFNKEWDRLAPGESSESGDDFLDDDEDLNELAGKAYEELQSDENTRMKPASERYSKSMKRSSEEVDDWEEVDD